MSTTGWLILTGVLTLIAAYSAGALLFMRKPIARMNKHIDSLSRENADLKGHQSVDYFVSINDWGPDFAVTDPDPDNPDRPLQLGRWRWVLWRGERGVDKPVDVGNATGEVSALLSAHTAMIKDWGGDYMTFRVMVEWKKVTQHAEDHS